VEKVIVRNNITKKSYSSSKFIELTADYDFASVEEFVSKYGLKTVMFELFEELIEAEVITNDKLYTEYIKALESGIANDSFAIMYKLDDEFCISITENIYLYHIVSGIEIANESVLPWTYVDSKLFLGDSWWESDEDIISDIQNLSVLDFIKKYKMY
jgi:hypothetical protein